MSKEDSTMRAFYVRCYLEWREKYHAAVEKGDDETAKFAAGEIHNYRQLIRQMGQGDVE